MAAAAGGIWGDIAGEDDEDKGGDTCSGETAELLPRVHQGVMKLPNSTPSTCLVASSLPAGVQVHHGRANVDSYCARTTAFWTHRMEKLEADGGLPVGPGGGEPTEGAMRGQQGACGVVVCGPASLQEAVEEGFQRHLAKAKGCWFRGFSTTS